MKKKLMPNSFSMDDWFDEQIKIVKNSLCTTEQIVSIINFKDEEIQWSSTLGVVLLIQIASNEKTPLEVLMAIFSNYGGIMTSNINDINQKNIRNLILKNPNWEIDEVIKILSARIEDADDPDQKNFIVASITDVDVLDDNDQKKIYKNLSKIVNNIYCLCEWTNNVIEMNDRKFAEELLSIAPKVDLNVCDYWDYKVLAETTILFMADINKEEDAYEASRKIYNMAISKVNNIDEWKGLFDSEYKILQLEVLLNDNCPDEIMKEVINGNDEEFKESLAKKLKPAGFGRLSNPSTGEVIAKIQNGKLVTIDNG
tara:strand:+ start:133 stop:1071 length:939 start_codon:yes stop_codon:yes gene_type:complete